jgi:hypothetical protein
MLLQQIQTLQFSNKRQAERLLLSFLRDIFSPDVQVVELRPLAVSLNSFNGFLTLASGKRLFFKTHIEPDGVIGEYYNAAQLAQAGYPVIQPIFSSTEAGKQLLIYEVVEEPSVFDVAWKIENGGGHLFPALTQAQQTADNTLFRLYMSTLQMQDADAAAKSPVHQLFYHRLQGGRLERFYGQVNSTSEIVLPDGHHALSTVRSAKWIINGQHYSETIDDLIQKATVLLQPSQCGASIIGHGDAHNGNVFFRQPPSLLYFDPAFAGRHHPLLDLAKPLFHNVFAMWMYFPEIKRDQTKITLNLDGENWLVEHDYAILPVREMFLESKVKRVLIPTLQELQTRGWLRDDWRPYLKAALFCCPLLTMNLTDSQKFPPEISLLGLAMAVEMGAESQHSRSLIDCTLDDVSRQLA